MKDPIVEEVHRIRSKLLEESGGDIKKMMSRMKENAKGYPNRITSKEEFRKTPATKRS
jgi:hypothetical protein